MIAGLQVAGWFNPLVHLGAAAVRLDQELACDFLIVEGRPRDRRPYVEALLKAHLGHPWSPFPCTWSPPGRHPLELRLQSLRSPPVGLRRYVAGAVAVAALATALAAAIWTTAPGQDAGTLPSSAVRLQTHAGPAPPS